MAGVAVPEISRSVRERQSRTGGISRARGTFAGSRASPYPGQPCRHRLGAPPPGFPMMSIADDFSRAARDYDAPRRQLIPCFDSLYGMALSLLPFGRDGAPRIVDLGAGTGLLSALIRSRLPRAQLQLIDIAEGMLDQARARFAGDAGVTITVADLATSALPKADAYVSALAIHHLQDAAKQALFRRIHAALEPGGVFVNIDQAAGRSAATDRAQHAAWLSAARLAGVDEAQLHQALGRMTHDRNAPLADQLDWMEAAGFAEVDLWFKQWFFCVYAGRRAR